MIQNYLKTGLLAKVLMFFCLNTQAGYLTGARSLQDTIPATVQEKVEESEQQRRQIRFRQREQYREAIRLIKLGRRSGYQQLMQQLEEYPLYSYLQYEEIIQNFPTTGKDEIVGFVERYKHTPLADRLMRNWLKYLGRKGMWYRYANSYDENYSTSSLECYRGYAQYRLGDHQAAFETAKKLWIVGHSQADECDSLFSVWQNAGRLTPDVAWQRFDKSLDANRLKLASYLTRYLSNADRSRARLYKQVVTNPAIVTRYSKFSKDTAENRKLILKGIGKLAKSDALAAIEHFANYSKTHRFIEAERDDILLMLGIRLMLQADEIDPLATLPERITLNPELQEAIIRNRLKHRDWPAVIAQVESLPENVHKLPRWQYWYARALYLSDSPIDKGKGFELFRKLATSRTFYGFLAADRIGESYQFENSPTLVDEPGLHALEQLPGMQRALELYVLEDRTQARREWLYASRNFSNQEQIMAAEIASRWGWHKQAIQSMINAKAWDDLDTRFPLAFHDLFSANASRADIPVPWSFAIARQESAFMPDARSSSGALGVMQLMPATARMTARKLGVRYRSSRELLDPVVNIKLGSAYLSMMLKRFDNNRILASAAYNAGPNRVDKWINDSLAFDAWIETIPFKETRQYVQNVLMFSTIYGLHLNENDPLVYQHEMSDFGKTQIEPAGPVGINTSGKISETQNF